MSGKIPAEKVLEELNKPEFSEESESDGEQRMVIVDAIEKATETTSTTVTPGPCIRPSDQESNQDSTSPSPQIITNIEERFPDEKDVRNRLNFSPVAIKNSAAFTFKTRGMENDLGTLLCNKISKIPILSDDFRRKIDEYKLNYTRGDVSFNIRNLLKYLYYFQKSEESMTRTENFREDIENELTRQECPLFLSKIIEEEYNRHVQNEKDLFIRFFDPKTKENAIFDHQNLSNWRQGLTNGFYNWARKLFPVMTNVETVHSYSKQNWTVIGSKKFLLVLKIIQEEKSAKSIIEELVGLLLNNERAININVLFGRNPPGGFVRV